MVDITHIPPDKAIIYRRTGYSPGSKLFWILYSSKKYTKEELQKKQEEEGYLMIPYEFFELKESFDSKDLEEVYIYTWCSWASAG